MADLTWWQATDIVRAHVVRISTPSGSGTGFLVAHGKKHGMCGVATAYHVVEHAHLWREPILLERLETGKHQFLASDDRWVSSWPERDLAAITFLKGDLDLPAGPLPLTPEDKFLRVGNRLGWLGYPAIDIDTLCFFEGAVSAWKPDDQEYLVDGVAINGVSGGPAFAIVAGTEVHLVGVVSAYLPNVNRGLTMPGLAKVRHVRELQEVVTQSESYDELRAREEAAAARAAAEAAAAKAREAAIKPELEAPKIKPQPEK